MLAVALFVLVFRGRLSCAR